MELNHQARSQDSAYRTLHEALRGFALEHGYIHDGITPGFIYRLYSSKQPRP